MSSRLTNESNKTHTMCPCWQGISYTACWALGGDIARTPSSPTACFWVSLCVRLSVSFFSLFFFLFWKCQRLRGNRATSQLRSSGREGEPCDGMEGIELLTSSSGSIPASRSGWRVLLAFNKRKLVKNVKTEIRSFSEFSIILLEIMNKVIKIWAMFESVNRILKYWTIIKTCEQILNFAHKFKNMNNF